MRPSALLSRLGTELNSSFGCRLAKLAPVNKRVKITYFMSLLLALAELTLSDGADNLMLLPLLSASLIQNFFSKFIRMFRNVSNICSDREMNDECLFDALYLHCKPSHIELFAYQNA